MRIFHYSHDTYGLGHIRRTLAIAEQIASDFPQATQLLVSGTPQPHCFKLPRQLDFIKIPTLGQGVGGEYHSPSLPLPLSTLKTLRAKIILEAVRHFSPDIVLVDKYPAGAQGEMLSALHYLQRERPETKLVLGMSDIEDSAMISRKGRRFGTDLEAEKPLVKGAEALGDKETKVRDLWRRQGIHTLMEELYDTIFHYGSRGIYDPVSEYRLSRKIEAKITSCGYIGRSDPVYEKDQIRCTLQMKTKRLVVVTAGGGEDGFELLKLYLEMLSTYRYHDQLSFDSLIIPGPLMSLEKRNVLQSYQSTDLSFTFLDSTPDMFSYLNAADLIVSMGGYNALCEAVSLRKQTIVIPHVKTRVEQLVRAGRFATQGLVQMLHPEKLSPACLLSKIHEGLEQGPPVSHEEAGLEMNGAANASRAIGHLFDNKAWYAPPVSSPFEEINQEIRYF